VSSLTANQRGILAVCGCMASYTVNDVLVKKVLQHYPVGEVIFVCGVMSTLLIGGVVLALGHAQQLRVGLDRHVAARSVFDGLSTVGFIAALAHMKLANLAAVLQVAPLLITALSVAFFREQVGWRRWTAITIGFLGALFVIKPVPSEFSIWAIAGAASALFSALREIQTRRIDRDIPTIVIAFWGAVGITLCGATFALTEDWRMLAAADLLELFIAAVFVGLAIYLLALGFRGVDMSVVAPFRYIYLLTSAIGGYLMFRELPDGWTVVGALLIVGSGLYTLHREAVRRRALTATTTPAL
jgi:drug/metabolite transporter (DMT)-like permease